jgi:hypothetical protein
MERDMRTYSRLIQLLLLLLCLGTKAVLANDYYLVFASPYSKNPASVFGHEFLVEGNNLIDFQADTESASFPLLGVKGVWGGFKARYRVKSLYEVVEKYTLESNRTLIFFPIKFSEREKVLYREVLDKNLDSVFMYKFFKFNCSHAIHKLLSETIDSLPSYRYIFMPQDLYYSLKKIDYLGEPFCITEKDSKSAVVPCKIDNIRSYLRMDFGIKKSENFEGVLYFRPFFHNNQDSHIFHEADNELEFFSVNVNYNRKGFVLDRFNIAKLRSVPPSPSLLSFSWFVGSAYVTEASEEKNAMQHELGLGKTFAFYEENFAFDFFIKDRVQNIFFSSRENWLGLELVLRNRHWRNWRWNIDFEFLKNYTNRKHKKQFDFWLAYDLTETQSLLLKEAWGNKGLSVELRFMSYINRF